MRRRVMLGCLIAAALFAGAPARGAVSISAGLDELVSLNFSGAGFSGSIGVFRSTAPPAAPGTVASGYLFLCDPGCNFHTFAQQQVPDAGLTMDLLGNSATINVTLTDQIGDPYTFAVRMDRPKFLFLNVPPSNMPFVNAWLDEEDPAVGARLLALPSIQRSNYVAAGTVNGSYAITSTFMDSTYRTLEAGVEVVLP